jgi:hypothetical protein
MTAVPVENPTTTGTGADRCMISGTTSSAAAEKTTPAAKC